VGSLAFGPGGTLAVGAANGDVHLWHGDAPLSCVMILT
jgi:hypothetical protein